MNYKNSINYTSETLNVLMNLASHDVFQYDHSLATDQNVSDLKTLQEIQNQCMRRIRDPQLLHTYFSDYGDTVNCLATVLCGSNVLTSLHFKQINKRYSGLSLKERLSFLDVDDENDEMYMHAFMELLDSTELNDSEKMFQIHALLDPEKHKEPVFEMCNTVEAELKRHADVLEKIYLQQRKELKKFDLKEWMKNNSVIQFTDDLDELLEKEAQIVLFDPCTLKLSRKKKEDVPVVIGAYLNLEDDGKGDSLKETVLTYAKIFSDESKLHILKLLSKKKMMNREIASETGLTTATISHHMSVLTDSQLVKATVSANKVIYELNKRKLCEIMKQMNAYFQEF